MGSSKRRNVRPRTLTPPDENNPDSQFAKVQNRLRALLSFGGNNTFISSTPPGGPGTDSTPLSSGPVTLPIVPVTAPIVPATTPPPPLTNIPNKTKTFGSDWSIITQKQ